MGTAGVRTYAGGVDIIDYGREIVGFTQQINDYPKQISRYSIFLKDKKYFAYIRLRQISLKEFLNEYNDKEHLHFNDTFRALSSTIKKKIMAQAFTDEL